MSLLLITVIQLEPHEIQSSKNWFVEKLGTEKVSVCDITFLAAFFTLSNLIFCHFNPPRETFSYTYSKIFNFSSKKKKIKRKNSYTALPLDLYRKLRKSRKWRFKCLFKQYEEIIKMQKNKIISSIEAKHGQIVRKLRILSSFLRQ